MIFKHSKSVWERTQRTQNLFRVDKSVVTSSEGLFETIIDAVGKSQNSIRVFMNLSTGFFQCNA